MLASLPEVRHINSDRILVIGANGQIGSELTEKLAGVYGTQNVLASDIAPASRVEYAPYLRLDVLDTLALAKLVTDPRITQIYHLAAVLSAAGERDPQRAWHLNITGLLNVLETARQFGVRKVFWPSSIAAFGPGTPREQAPQYCVMDPNTIYRISKLAGERWCEYYHRNHGIDVRSLRYPGLISYKTPPGGGTTDYAVEIFHAAKAGKEYRCFVGPDTRLPMMYMPDALRATLELMEAPANHIRIRSSYNVAALSFSVSELVEAIRDRLPDFRVSYKPDFRQAIADAWPATIDDSPAVSGGTIKKCVNEKGGVAFRLKVESLTSTTHPVAAGRKGDATHEGEEHNCRVRVNGLLRDDGNAGAAAHSGMVAGFARSGSDGVSVPSKIAASPG